MAKPCEHLMIDWNDPTDHSNEWDWVCYHGRCLSCGKLIETRYRYVDKVALDDTPPPSEKGD